jgi:sugar (pentulose or hexulose) kinase
LWSEQDPRDWWTATLAALADLCAAQPAAYAAVRGIGLSGQMHGATLLDTRDRLLRPAIPLARDLRRLFRRQCRVLAGDRICRARVLPLLSGHLAPGADRRR